MNFRIKSKENLNIVVPAGGGFNSSTDIFGLASGAKEAAYLTFENDKIKKFLRVLNCFGSEKDFKAVEAPNRDWIYKLNGNKGKKHFFIGENYDHLLKLRNAFDHEFNKVSHQEIGILLSYPKCCANRDNYIINVNNYFPRNPYKINFLMNNFYIKSNSNVFLFSHHPCSHQCKETLEYSKKIYEWLDRFPGVKKRINALLKLPVAYLFPEMKNNRALSVGVAYAFNGCYMDDDLIRYDDIYYFKKFVDEITNIEEAKDLFEKFKLGDKIQIEEGIVKIFKDNELREVIKNERLIFINPQ